MPDSITIYAELEIWHSRPFTPTRRLSLGTVVLPNDPSPGFSGILLGGVVSAHLGDVDDHFVPDLHRLLSQIERGERVVQPRLRHRLQTDQQGLAKSVHRLIGDRGQLRFEFNVTGSGLAQVLGAMYSLERLDEPARRASTMVIGRAMRWRGPLDASFVAYLATRSVTSISGLADPRAWALEILGFPAGTVKPSRRQVQERYRAELNSVHPDLGGEIETASRAIEDLAEARRVLLHS